MPGTIFLCMLSFYTYGQNQVLSYIELGSKTPVNTFNYGMAYEASIYLSSRIALQAGVRLANQYPSGLGELKAGVTVFPCKNSIRWAIENVIDYSNYAPYPMGQLYYRITGAWQTKHFRIDFGNAFAFFIGSGIVKYHLFRPSYCLKGMIRTEDKAWNAAFFIRNFNRFEVHGAKCTEWGSELSARIDKKWKVFCEPYVTTVGNFNGTATFYNFNFHIGGAYLW